MPIFLIQQGDSYFDESWNFNFYMVSKCSILFTDFRTVFVFVLRPFLPLSVNSLDFNGNFNGEMVKNCFFGNKIWQERATTIQLGLLSYIFKVLFRDTLLAHICCTQSDGHMAINGHFGHIWPYLAIYGHMAIGPYAKNIGKWGIPGKNFKNVAQQC